MILKDDRSAALWLFGERYDSVRPTDDTGNLAALEEGATNALPPVVSVDVEPLIGFGREFDGATTGLEVEDANYDLRLDRGLAIVALLKLDLAAQDAAGVGTIIQRGGRDTGTFAPFGLSVEVTNLATKQVTLAMFWDEEDGDPVVDTGVTFTWEDEEAFYFLAAVREVVDGELVCTYRVNDRAYTGDSHPLDVGSGSGDPIYVGVGRADPDYQDYLAGVLNALHVVGEAVSDEELEWTYLRIFVDIPAAEAALRRTLPEGVYSSDPDSAIQREIALQGRALGMVRSNLRRLRDYNLPAKSWGLVLERWEQITGHSPKAGDWIARRRTRVANFLANVQGFRRDALSLRLEELFGLDAADIEFLEYDNTLEHDFTVDPEDYHQEDGNGTWTVGSGVANFEATTSSINFIGAADGSPAGWLLWSVADPVDSVFGALVDVSGDADALAGLVIGDRVRQHWLIIALDCDTPQNLVAVKIEEGAVVSVDTIDDPDGPLYILVRYQGEGEYTVQWGTDLEDAAESAPTTITGGPEPLWAGFVGACKDDSAVSIDGDLTDLVIHTPNSGQRWNWFAYRDPGLGGEYDIDGAHQLVQRIAPAHTTSGAVDVRAFVLGTSRLGREPLG